MKILFEDKNIIACEKPVGVLSQSGDGENMPTLLSEHFKEIGEDALPYCIHRLDRSVGGAMIFAKNKSAAGKLSSLVSTDKFEKTYLAIIKGRPSETEGVFKDLLFKDSAKNKSFVVKRMRKGVKEASLEYRVLQYDEENKLSLIMVKLHTGRTHQIRVQFASRKLPLLGDGKYGSRENKCGVALWSYKIGFCSPFTKEKIEINCTPPNVYPWSLFKTQIYK